MRPRTGPTSRSQLAAAHLDRVTVQMAMGYSRLATTGRDLHARPASDWAAAFMRAIRGVGHTGT